MRSWIEGVGYVNGRVATCTIRCPVGGVEASRPVGKTWPHGFPKMFTRQATILVSLLVVFPSNVLVINFSL
jgi:hypothetical protein